MDKKKVFMIGMPSSGKTTYLASLCRLLLYGGQETGWKLDVKDVPEGFERVQILIKNINSYKAVRRTYGLELNNVALSLYNKLIAALPLLARPITKTFFPINIL